MDDPRVIIAIIFLLVILFVVIYGRWRVHHPLPTNSPPELLWRLLTLSPPNNTAYDALLHKAYDAYEAGELELAEQQFTEAISAQPGNVEAYYRRAYIRAKQKKFSEAAEDFSRALEIEPEHLQTHLLQSAMLIYDQQEYTQAIDNLNKAIEFARSQHRKHVDYGVYISSTEKWHSAVTDQLSRLLYLRAVAYSMVKQNEQAIADYSELIDLNESSTENKAELHVQRGHLFLAQGSYAAARQDFDTALKADESSVRAYDGRAAVFYHQGDYQQAVHYWTQAISLEPDTAMLYNNRGEARFAAACYEDALADFEKALELQLESRHAQAGKAIAQYMLGSEADARAVWQQLIADDARYGDINAVADDLRWATPLTEAARKLNQSLD